MIYFILWVVFLLAAIIAVVVVSMQEGRRRRELMPAAPAQQPIDEPGEEFAEAADGFGEAPAEEAVEFGEFDEAGGGGDDFGAFDDEFK